MQKSELNALYQKCKRVKPARTPARTVLPKPLPLLRAMSRFETTTKLDSHAPVSSSYNRAYRPSTHLLLVVNDDKHIRNLTLVSGQARFGLVPANRRAWWSLSSLPQAFWQFQTARPVTKALHGKERREKSVHLKSNTRSLRKVSAIPKRVQCRFS